MFDALEDLHASLRRSKVKVFTGLAIDTLHEGRPDLAFQFICKAMLVAKPQIQEALRQMAWNLAQYHARLLIKKGREPFVDYEGADK